MHRYQIRNRLRVIYRNLALLSVESKDDKIIKLALEVHSLLETYNNRKRERIEKTIDLYIRGQSMKDICKIVGLSSARVYGILDEQGIERKRKKGRRRKNGVYPDTYFEK